MQLFRCIYSCTGDITATNGDANTNFAFKNCAQFTQYVTHINDELTDDAEDIDLAMPIYYLIKHNNSYLDTSGSLWQFKRDESSVNDNGNPDIVTTNN